MPNGSLRIRTSGGLVQPVAQGETRRTRNPMAQSEKQDRWPPPRAALKAAATETGSGAGTPPFRTSLPRTGARSPATRRGRQAGGNTEPNGSQQTGLLEQVPDRFKGEVVVAQRGQVTEGRQDRTRQAGKNRPGQKNRHKDDRYGRDGFRLGCHVLRLTRRRSGWSRPLQAH